MNMSPRKTYAMCECALYRQKTVFKTVCGKSVVGKMKCVGLRVCGGYIYLGYFESWKSLLSPLLVCLLSLIFSDPSLAFFIQKRVTFQRSSNYNRPLPALT